MMPSYYLAADVRELDRIAIEEIGIPGFTLMQRAGKAAFTALLKRWPDCKNVVCFCGNGNNGGDGYIIAALAKAQGLGASVIAVGNPDKLQGDARKAFDMASENAVTVLPFSGFSRHQAGPETVIVDAMLGTGLAGNVRGDTLTAIQSINAQDNPVMAMDIPSGLCSDTGKVLGAAVKAELTVTFIGRKVGQILASGRTLCGELVFDDLGVPADIFDQVSPQ